MSAYGYRYNKSCTPSIIVCTFSWIFICLLQKRTIASLTSVSYKPNPGVLREQWIKSNNGPYSISQFKSNIPGYPHCPHRIENIDKFQYEYLARSSNEHKYFRYTSYLLAPASGPHKVFAICLQECKLDIELQPNSATETIHIRSYSSAKKEYSNPLEMGKGFRYKLTLLLAGGYDSAISMQVGILLSNGTEISTLDQEYLRRSMELYKINGLLTEQFDTISAASLTTTTYEKFLSSNSPQYPNSPSKVFCKSTIYEDYRGYGNYYALRYTGYFQPVRSGIYEFYLKCNHLCQLSFTREDNQVVKEYDNIYISGRTLKVGSLIEGKYYKTEIFFMETAGSDYLWIKWKSDGESSFTTLATSELSNLLQNETRIVIPSAAVTTVNSTSLTVAILSLPIAPPEDQWSTSQAYDIVYYRSSNISTKRTIPLNGTLPISKTITGLNKYSDYHVYLHYYGKIQSTREYNLISSSILQRTAEDVPDDYPPNLTAKKMTSSSIKLSWGALLGNLRTNGIIVGYRARYAIKGVSSRVWSYQDTQARSITISNLKKYTVYEFSVAANTSKGAGVFSSLVEERTKEDVPSAPPSTITGRNTSSTSILLTWGDVPIDHRNGIITEYQVYIRESTPDAVWPSPITVQQQSYEQKGLKFWTLYDVKLAAITSVGPGIQSNVFKIRTDEDRPTGSPKMLQSTANSSTTIIIKWNEIDENLRNGEIISYKVKYRRKDSMNGLKSIISSDQSVLLTGLDKYVEYTMVVAGRTSKGDGKFSTSVTQRTLEDVPGGSPKSVSGGFVSETELYVTWEKIPVSLQNGIIRSYKIAIRMKDSSEEWNVTSVNSQTFRKDIGGLRYYTLYDVKVAGETSRGLGPYSFPIYIRTDAYGPTKPPANFNGTFVNHTCLIVHWSRVPVGSRQGIIIGYKFSFIDATNSSAKWVNHTRPNDNITKTFNFTINGLKIYTPYIFKILAYTYRGEGPFSRNITIWTDDYIPEAIPRNISNDNRTSTDITLSWRPMDEANGAGNGKITGYRVRYQVVDCHADRPVGCDENHIFTMVTNDSRPHITLPRLRKFTNYSISIQAINRKGVSNYTSPLYIKTEEDKPDAPPQKIESWPGKSDSLVVFWSPIPESLRNGIITGYRIFYKQLNVPVRNLKRAPRSVNDLTLLGAQPGEQVQDVNGTAYKANLEGLKKHSWYQIRIGALTSKGLGPTFSINGTCKQEAPVEAPYFDIIDKYSLQEVSLKWKNISIKGARGEVLGCRIHYWPIEQNDVPVFNGKLNYIDVFEPNRSLTIKGLMAYTTYGIMVSAFTEGGFGVSSRHQKAETCRCPKTLTTAWESILPLVYKNGSLLGIMPKYVNEAISTCCSNCSLGQGPSIIDWDHDALNHSSMKSNIGSMKSAIMSGTHITVPIFTDRKSADGSTSKPFKYIAFLQSPGMVFFKRKASSREVGNECAVKLIESLLSLYSLLIVVILFIVLAGLIFWLLERGDNKDEFPDNFFHGSGAGTWLAFITMTTAGYGDIAPKTKLGRLFTIVWTLVGVVLTALIVGQIANSLTAKNIQVSGIRKSASSNEKVMASNETLLIAITQLRKRAVVGNTSDPGVVKRALLNADVSKVMIEAYRAGEMKDSIDHPEITFDKLETAHASYGIVLNGEARRLESCIGRFVKENSQRILKDVEATTVYFESKDPHHGESAPIILSSDADITIIAMRYSGWTLLALIAVGAFYDLRRYIRGRSKVTVEDDSIQELFQSTDVMVRSMFENVSKVASAMDEKHATERRRLVKRGLKDVKAMMPHLLIFHEDLREGAPKIEKEDMQVDWRQNRSNQYHYESDSDNSNDMPIDYKVS